MASADFNPFARKKAFSDCALRKCPLPIITTLAQGSLRFTFPRFIWLCPEPLEGSHQPESHLQFLCGVGEGPCVFQNHTLCLHLPHCPI